ncbi:DUF4388 domain-containing protein [Geobacter pelophilus]|uniref:DUF4388 domain-containing protein n=1 Tax=Geoanaerobacter pelophilus TaxID=60036 RepID=A0AAW4L4C8_9BACT|nr:DUF4388 domain-containing protein [Geoanaerobacter pelophilus]MBT0663818.1 DUF4388 domain-containing protein [Geoanaerobacter pelophilus]
MSFVGELEHLPIVDVIQLLNSTRKSGTLCVKSGKGESQLVFVDGYIVGANHVNNSVRIGQVLVDMGAITQAELEESLAEQFNAGANRKPLVATLIEGGRIDKDVAYKGLENLIEMTIVEVLTWTSGTFELDIDKITVSDEYRYFPEKLQQDICLNTQSVLMDALRIYDEKMRDGTLTPETFAAMDIPIEGFDSNWEAPEITADLLGLDDLDNLDRTIPDVFLGVKEIIAKNEVDPSDVHKKAISAELAGIPEDQQEKIYTLLANLSGNVKEDDSLYTTPIAVILFTRNELLRHIITTLARHEGYLVFSTDEAETLDHIIDKAIARELTPVLVIDPPSSNDPLFSANAIMELLLRKRMKYPQIAIIQMISSHNGHFSLQALQWGVRLLLPWPDKRNPNEDFAEEIISLLETLRVYLSTTFLTPEHKAIKQLRECIFELDALQEAPEVSFVILKFTAAIFERSMTFVVGKSELIAERGIGIHRDKGEGASPPMMFRIPIGEQSLFKTVIENGQLYHGDTKDESITADLHKQIGAPDSSTIVLIPVSSMGRCVALIYGDFGNKPGSPVQIELLEILAHHAGLVLENTLYRKKFAKTS